jgi:hypothetical protein
VGQLVQDGLRPHLVGGVGDLGAEDVLVADGDRARVLHRPGVELGDEELVVLGERVRVGELLLEPVEALPRHREDRLGVEVLGERGPAVDPERHGAPVLPLPAAVHRVVRAGDERGDVRGQPRGRLEAPDVVLGLGGRRVRDHRPALGGGDGELEGGLQVRLLEAGEDPPGVGDLELGVQVSLLVDRVDEAVQPLAGVRVRAVGDDVQLVVALDDGGERQARVGEDLRRIERLAVEPHLAHLGGDQVGEGRAGRAGGEAHGGLGAEGAPGLRSGEVQRDLVAVDREQPRPLLGLFPGQIRARHRGGLRSSCGGGQG